ncbi:hypothetical protein POTOM_054082 [Populus tomentosa]|uniref:Uncharacterized protein n=1 Tax=Populus tomentosa TaxID=118781 RepID=A0A8X8BZU3_POPTO|nr:hypothetical protein POTOM_054082 [Populus tomentosa]
MTAPSLLSYLTACNNSVKVPAHLSAIMPILLDPTVAQLLEAINHGFEPDYCGYPVLKLNCSDQDLEITIEKLTYKVLGINNQSRILSVARKDYAENICPTLILNTTWIPNLLSYTSDDHNITINYGCPTQGAPTALPFVPQFPCKLNKRH